MKLVCDVLVVGAGPAGICAAVTAAEAGANVCLVDENPAVGGQIWRHSMTSGPEPKDPTFLQWNQRLEQSTCRRMNGWQVVEQVGPGVIRLAMGDATADVVYQRLIAATGARERLLPFPGWTLPGVMGAGALGAFLRNGYRPRRGQRVLLAGSGPLLLACAAELAAIGTRPAGLFEQASRTRLATMLPELLRQPAKLAQAAAYSWKILPTWLRTHCWIAAAEGRDRVERVMITDGRRYWWSACDVLACGYGLVPNLELPRMLGCALAGAGVAVGPLQQCSVEGVFCAGELTGVGGVEKAMLEGQIAGLAAAGRPHDAARLVPELRRWKRFAGRLASAYALRPELKKLSAPETIVCRCEDVHHGELREQDNWRSAKLATRCGMGACQGRICGAAAEFLYGWKNESQRPPLSPVPVGALAVSFEASAEITSAGDATGCASGHSLPD